MVIRSIRKPFRRIDIGYLPARPNAEVLVRLFGREFALPLAARGVYLIRLYAENFVEAKNWF